MVPMPMYMHWQYPLSRWSNPLTTTPDDGQAASSALGCSSGL